MMYLAHNLSIMSQLYVVVIWSPVLNFIVLPYSTIISHTLGMIHRQGHSVLTTGQPVIAVPLKLNAK